MRQNIVTLNLSEAQLSAVDAALTELETLFAGLVSLTPQAKKRLLPMGERSEPFCRQSLQVLIQNQLGDHALGVARLAQQSGCSADHLSRLYRRTHGEPLLAQVNRLRLDRAERLLRDTSLSVKEVAWACGFASAGYFIRQFRARSGRTPGQWREGTL